MSLSEVYDYTDKLKELLMTSGKVHDISLEFKNISEISERIKFVQNLLTEFNLTVDTTRLKLAKLNAISESCRTKGNQFYVKKQFLDALEAYNQSLCFAEKGSIGISMAYANRSAVFFELQLYDTCLKNIRMAKDNGYPQENMEKLLKREEMCRSMINKDDQREKENVGSSFLKLSYGKHKQVPFIADCLELKSSEKFGRYIITTTPLKTGDVVSVEPPFAQQLLPQHRYKYCATCLNDNFLNLIACKNCTSTMFCSDDCARVGTKKFHKYECPIIDKLNALSTKILRISIRTFFEAVDVCRGNIEELKSLVEENCGSEKTVFDLNGLMTRRNVLIAVDALQTNERSRTTADLFQRSGIVAIISQLFLDHTPLKELLATEDDQDFFRCFVFKQTQIAGCNYHGLYNGIVRKAEVEQNPQYASGSFPFCSLINHSCAPNIIRVTENGINRVVVNRPIPAGGQLFDNYGFHHCLENFNERQSGLAGQYMFKCFCEACTQKFPLFPELKLIDKKLEKFLSDDIQMLSTLDVDRAIDRFKSYCEYIDRKDKNYPCKEVSSIQECLLRCMTIFTMSEFKLKLAAK